MPRFHNVPRASQARRLPSQKAEKETDSQMEPAEQHQRNVGVPLRRRFGQTAVLFGTQRRSVDHIIYVYILQVIARFELVVEQVRTSNLETRIFSESKLKLLKLRFYVLLLISHNTNVIRPWLGT